MRRRVYLDPGKARFLRKRGSSREPPHDRRTDAGPEQILLQREDQDDDRAGKRALTSSAFR
jgi:hypothetical protein